MTEPLEPPSGDRERSRERLYERMDPGEVTLDREPIGGPIPKWQPAENDTAGE